MQIFAWILVGLIAITGPVAGLADDPTDLSRQAALHTPSLAALPGLKRVFAGTPKPLGLENGALLPCPDSPNCVVSQTPDPDHAIAPLSYQIPQENAYTTLIDVLSVVPRTTIVERTENYIRAESSSRLMGFVDDVEFYFPSDETVIHMRSAARVGESDLGVNRRRLEQIRLAAQDLGL